MTPLTWCAVFPARGMSLHESTAIVRTLAGRPRFGLLGLQPLVVFELWIHPDRVRWLVGMDERIADRLPGEFSAQCPSLVLTPLEDAERPEVIAGREVRFRSIAYPIRTDVAEGVTAALLRIRADLRQGEAVAPQFVVGPGQFFSEYPKRNSPLDVLGVTTAPDPDSTDQQAWRHKVSEPLFAIRGRTGAVAADRRRAAGLTRPVFSALALANDRHGRVQVSAQSSRIALQLSRVMGRVRTWSSIVNASELAVLTGWNIAELDIPGSGSGFRPPPKELLKDADSAPRGERIAGISPHPSTRNQAVCLPLSSYAAHCHAIGPSGSGKSTVLAHWALSEAYAGRSLCLIEPKGDLCEEVMARLDPSRHDDLVLIDSGADSSLPVVGFNPVSGAREDAERRADALLGLFKELFGSAIGPRSSDVLLHALMAVSRLEDGALTDVMPFLTNSGFRRWALSRTSDPLTLGPWAAWFESLSAGERNQAVSPVGNKLRIISARPSIRRLLGQSEPKFALDSLFERPTLLLVNLNAGAVGPEASKIIGTLLLSQLWDVIQRQTLKPVDKRRIVPIIIDEFQGYTSGLDFADVLARARGAGAPFTIAHQHLDQLNPTLRAAVLANARSRLVFKPAEGDGRALAAVLGAGVTAEDLERLPAFHAVARVLIGGGPSSAFEVATSLLPEPINDVPRLRRMSAERYGADPVALDEAIRARWQNDKTTGSAPIGVRKVRQ